MNSVIFRTALFHKVKTLLEEKGFAIIKQDQERPWGGFLVIDEGQAIRFAEIFFPEFNLAEIEKGGKLSPKFLLVAPEKRLSWQYHFRRAELWKVIEGKVKVVTSPTDLEKSTVVLEEGETITLDQGERHRLIGTEAWGIIAEIWQHTSATHPSDEEDIVRLQDDYGRN